MGESVAAHLKIVEAAALRLSKTQLLGKPALNSWTALLDYCTAAMARNPNEEFRVLFLDRKNMLIADEVQSSGTVDHTPVYPREIVKRALELGASVDHPGAQPSIAAIPRPHRADIEMTREIAAAAKALQHRGARSYRDRQKRACQFQGDGIALIPLPPPTRGGRCGP